MNNNPNTNNEPIETLEPQAPTQPVPEIPQQPVENVQPQQPMGTNPHQHVDMNSLTPRTVFETSVNSNTPAPENATPQPTTPQTAPAQPAPKEKSVAFPLILFVLAIAAGGYLLYNQFKPKPEPIIYQDEEKEPTKNETEETPETKDEETTGEDTKAEEPGEAAVTQNPQENTPAPESVPATGDVEIISGAILYLYSDGSIGMDGFDAKYISHSNVDITVEITINGGTPKTYTLKYGEKTSIAGLKNQITITKEKEYFPIAFS